MCIKKTLIANKKYMANKKNGGVIPHLEDVRMAQIWVPCGECYICRKKKARQWRVRISEDIKKNKDCKIVLLTFSTENLKKLAKHKECKGYTGYELDNQICKLAVKLFRERWRKKYGRSIRHWLITELGHGKTEHVHMHGIVWKDNRYILEDDFMNEVERYWQYGWVGRGKKNYITGNYENYVNARTANYFTKYVNKIDEEHEMYKQIVLTSPGIGKNFIESTRAKNNTFNGKKTNQLYYPTDGGTLPMPEYYRNKLYTEEQKEELTINYLNEDFEYIDGKEIRKDLGDVERKKLYDNLKMKNARLGYSNKNWMEKQLKKVAENAKRKEMHRKRFTGELKEIAPQALRGLGIAPESAESVNSSLRSLGAETQGEIMYNGEKVPEWVPGRTEAILPNYNWDREDKEKIY